MSTLVAMCDLGVWLFSVKLFDFWSNLVSFAVSWMPEERKQLIFASRLPAYAYLNAYSVSSNGCLGAFFVRQECPRNVSKRPFESLCLVGTKIFEISVMHDMG